MRWAAHTRGLLPTKGDWSPVRTTWRPDVTAGLTVGIIALPLALAFGVSSGVGAAAGLVTAIVAGAVAAIFGGSNVQVSGPTGAMVVILAPIVATHGVGAVALLSLMAGTLVLLMGALGLGRSVALIPWPVVEGFTLGIGVIIFLQQVPMATGTEVAAGQNTVVAAAEAISVAQWPTVAITIGLVLLVTAIVIGLPRWRSAIPASLIAVVIATVVVELLNLDIPRIGALPSSLPSPTLPPMSPAMIQSLLIPAFAVAVLAAIESLLSARVAASMAETGSYNPDRELVGQGLASVASGLFGGMPATGAIARTAVAVRSGARTRFAALFHAIVLLAVVYLAAGMVGKIPLAALAGVLMVTASRMSSRATVRSILRTTRSDALAFVVTAVITIAFDLIFAILIGVLVAVFFALRTVAEQSGVTRLPASESPADGDEHIAVFRLAGAMFFGASERVLTDVSAVTGVRVVILRLDQVRMLDASGAHALVEIVSGLERRGKTVLLDGVQPRFQQVTDAVGLFDSLRHENHMFRDYELALAHARSHIAREEPAPDPS
ncbi:SulP family inorganic anion transporter [Tomitella biformata]|uniref:SulP family inorganic anion transporter n=1 Tax=Tomitella biformata TaxID=630403 RepID=UPI0004AD84C2|nr:SulP family inorganic anion transporter [Tomitella biformata]